MKNQKGISLIALVITIVVMIIIAGITIYNGGGETIDKAVFNKSYSELHEIAEAIAQTGDFAKLNSDRYEYIGTAQKDEEPYIHPGTQKQFGDGYYLISTTDEKRKLGLDAIEGQYIVNYTTGDVVSVQPILYEGETYYELKELDALMNVGSYATNAEYSDDKKVNKPFMCNGMVPVKQSGNSWIITTVNDTEWYDYSATAQKWANVMLLDELTTSYHTNEQIRNMNVEQLAGEVVTSNGSMFVWIPRYTYKEVGGNIQIVYSKLLKDYTDNGYLKHPAFYYGEYSGSNGNTGDNGGFKSGGTELTGIWISKYSARLSNI